MATMRHRRRTSTQWFGEYAMFDSISPAGMCMRRKPLAACLAAMFCLAAPAAAVAATTWTVNTCDETNVGSGTTGTLRYAAANAVSGDTIDLSTLTCSTISLTTGGGGASCLHRPTSPWSVPARPHSPSKAATTASFDMMVSVAR
jgi:hypothetical protein